MVHFERRTEMKKRILAAIVSTFTLFSVTANAATSDQGTLNLSGVVNEAVSLSISAEAVAGSLDLATTQSDLLVATVSEFSNTALGYDVTISSANDSNLVRNGGTETIGYTLKYDGSSIDLSASSSSPAAAKSDATGGVVSDTSQVQISYTGVNEAQTVSGTYEDTLTIEIAAKN